MDRMTSEFLSSVCADKRTLEMMRYLINGGYIRVVNYHDTLPKDMPRIEREIAWFSKYFVNVTMQDIDTFFETREWPYDKPGLIPAVFEGFRTHYDYMLPVLRKYGVRGWYYLPSLFMDVPVEQQYEFAKDHGLDIMDHDLYPDGRYALTWDEVRDIARDNEICCHSGTHFEITRETSDEDMYREIVTANRRLEEELGKKADVFCWLYGEEYNYNKRAHKFLEEAGFRYVVGNLKMEKIR